jgi:hypothetical protein
MLFTFSIVSVSALIPSLALVTHLLPILTSPGYYGQEKGYYEFADKYSPEWLWPRDPNANKWFYEKLPEGESIPWEAWRAPLFAWSLFALMLYFTMLGMALLLHRQWVQNEHLSFPDLQMPMAVTESGKGQPGGRILRNVPLLVGLGISAFVRCLNGLNFYYPTIVPEVPLVSFITVPFIGWLWLPINFVYIGLAFLTPLDVSFSIWFFHLLFLLSQGLANWLGLSAAGATDFGALYYTCSSGGFLTIAAYYVWRVLKQVRTMTADHRKEALCYLGWVVIGVAGMTAWLMAAGVGPGWSVAWVITFLLAVVVMARAVSEAGVFNTQVLADPGPTFANSLGLAEVMGPRNVCVMAFQGYANGGDWGRGYLMPNFMQSLKLCVDDRWPKGRVMLALFVAAALAIPISLYAGMTLLYEKGANLSAAGVGEWNFRVGNVQALQNPASWVQHPLTPQVKTINRLVFAGFAGGTAAIIYLRSLFYWLPFHPLGFLLCGGFVARTLFLSTLIGWACKSLILRYGGGQLFSRMRYLFIGLILGDFTMMAFWGLIKYLSGGSGYTLGIY